MAELSRRRSQLVRGTLRLVYGSAASFVDLLVLTIANPPASSCFSIARDYVRCLKNGECVSVSGTHLGHNLVRHILFFYTGAVGRRLPL